MARLNIYIVILFSIPIFSQNNFEEKNKVTYEELMAIFDTNVEDAAIDIYIDTDKSRFFVSIYDENSNPTTKRKCRNIKTTNATNQKFITKLKDEKLIQNISHLGYYYPENYNFKKAKRILFITLDLQYGYHSENYVIALKKPSEIEKALEIAKSFYQNEQCFDKLDRKSRG